MVDISALNRALPLSKLQPGALAVIWGFDGKSEDTDGSEGIPLLEPPCTDRQPYIEPFNTIRIMSMGAGLPDDAAHYRAHAAMDQMVFDIDAQHWLVPFRLASPMTRPIVPVSKFVSWLRQEAKKGKNWTNALWVDAIEFVAERVTEQPMITEREHVEHKFSLRTRALENAPQALCEAILAPPWLSGPFSKLNKKSGPYFDWTKDNAASIKALESQLGQVALEKDVPFGFDEKDNERQAVVMHRFLLLHWLCTFEPFSSFVGYLLKVSGASSVHELKAALLDPANYKQPFELGEPEGFFDVDPCNIQYYPQRMHKGAAIMFLTESAAQVAPLFVLERMFEHVTIMAPRALLSPEWLEKNANFCRSVSICYTDEGLLADPWSAFVWVDEFILIADEPENFFMSFRRKDEEISDLVLIAQQLGLKAHNYNHGRGINYSLEEALGINKVDSKLKALKAKRRALTHKLRRVALRMDAQGARLTDGNGAALGFERLDIPFKLAQRIVRWIREGCRISRLSDNPVAEDRARHEQEGHALVKLLEGELGKTIEVAFEGASDN